MSLVTLPTDLQWNIEAFLDDKDRAAWESSAKRLRMANGPKFWTLRTAARMQKDPLFRALLENVNTKIWKPYYIDAHKISQAINSIVIKDDASSEKLKLESFSNIRVSLEDYVFKVRNLTLYRDKNRFLVVRFNAIPTVNSQAVYTFQGFDKLDLIKDLGLLAHNHMRESRSPAESRTIVWIKDRKLNTSVMFTGDEAHMEEHGNHLKSFFEHGLRSKCFCKYILNPMLVAMLAMTVQAFCEEYMDPMVRTAFKC